MSIFWKKFWRGLFASAAVALMLPAASPSIAAFITGGSGGGGTPGGSDTQVQYNDAGAFGGDAGLVFNGTTNALTTTGLLSVNQATADTRALVLSGYSVTGSGSTNMIEITGTLNTSSHANILQMDITRTNDDFASNFILLKRGGSQQLAVDLYGSVITGGTVTASGVTSNNGITMQVGGNLTTSTSTLTAGGDASKGKIIMYSGSTGGVEITAGTGAPTISAPKGSLYLRKDGTGTNDRIYVNTDGGTTWTYLVTGA